MHDLDAEAEGITSILKKITLCKYNMRIYFYDVSGDTFLWRCRS
jgi:hypothetical protein